MGRTVTLLARLVQDGWTAQGRAIAADRKTALHVDPSDGTAEVLPARRRPTPYVYFLTDPGAARGLRAEDPALTYRNMPSIGSAPAGASTLGSGGGGRHRVHAQRRGGGATSLRGARFTRKIRGGRRRSAPARARGS